jgi:hypothetical protein
MDDTSNMGTGLMNPQAPQQVLAAQQMTPQQQEMQKQQMLQAMMKLNANQKPTNDPTAQGANALAKGLAGYMQGMQMKKMGMGFGGSAAPTEMVPATPTLG